MITQYIPTIEMFPMWGDWEDYYIINGEKYTFSRASITLADVWIYQMSLYKNNFLVATFTVKKKYIEKLY
jgi:hypothetical protein